MCHSKLFRDEKQNPLDQYERLETAAALVYRCEVLHSAAYRAHSPLVECEVRVSVNEFTEVWQQAVF